MPFSSRRRRACPGGRLPVRFRIPVVLAVVVFALVACAGEPEPTPGPTLAGTTDTLLHTPTNRDQLTAVAPTPTPVGATPTRAPQSVAIATVSPTSTTSDAPDNSSGTVPAAQSDSLVNLLALIERRIEQIRGIDTPPPVDHSFVDQAGMQAELDEIISDPEVVVEIVRESALLKLLGVIPQDSELADMYQTLLGSQVLGLYDAEKKEFFVLDDGQSGADSLGLESQMTYAHEYVHRLQDSKFDLETITDRDFAGDASTAVSALVEGDATTAQTQYMFENFNFQQLTDLYNSAVAAQADLPVSPYFLRRSLEFPYVEGAAFVAELVGSGGFAAVDGAFENLPRSTEQVLHPEKYLGSEEPIEIDIPDDAMGTGWSVQAESVLGEFFLRTWLEALGSARADVATTGWGGDAYAVFEDGSGEFALGAVIAWDADTEAGEFFEVASNALDARTAQAGSSGSGTGIPGIVGAWDGPGGFLILSRQVVAGLGEVIVMAIAPTAQESAALVAALVGG